jgi:integrase/recombinase XerD
MTARKSTYREGHPAGVALNIAYRSLSSHHQGGLVSQKTGRAFIAHGIALLLKGIYMDASVFGASSHSGRRTFLTRLAERGIAPLS